MKVSFLTSGFPNGFTDDFIQCIKDYYDNDGSIVFIASDFSGSLKTHRHVDKFITMFKDSAIVFNEKYVIDGKVTRDMAIKYIEKASIVWILGGDTLKQISYIKDYDLIPALQKREGVTIGMSAGSINMAKKVVLPKDESDNIPELSIYTGIGLVDVNVEPHFNEATEGHIEEVKKAAEIAPIYALHDGSFIKVDAKGMRAFGTYQLFAK